MDPKLKEAGWEKYAEFKIWFDKRLDAAIKKVGGKILLEIVALKFSHLQIRSDLHCIRMEHVHCTCRPKNNHKTLRESSHNLR